VDGWCACTAFVNEGLAVLAENIRGINPSPCLLCCSGHWNSRPVIGDE
jgi:hypothetical protein